MSGTPLKISSLSFLTPGDFPDDDPYAGPEQTLRQFELGERLGFDGAWIRQRHLEHGVGSAAVFLAAASQRTRRVELGTAVIPIGYESPFRLAEDLSTADVLSGGRLQVGLSAGVPPLVGPAVAGLLIAAVGTGWVFAISTASFAAVIAGPAVIRPRPRPTARVRTPWKGAGTAGLRYVAARPRFLAVLAIFGLVMTFGANFPITMTLFAGQVFAVGSRGLGFMSTALAVGTIAGTLMAARRAAPRVSKVVVGAVVFGAAETAAALAPAYAVFLVLLVPAGFGLMMLNAAVSGYAQTEVEEAVRGRVVSVYTAMGIGGTPMGDRLDLPARRRALGHGNRRGGLDPRGGARRALAGRPPGRARPISISSP